MNILVTGQCTLHWGRMEFGNIGNFYVIEPFFSLLRRRFPSATVHTTFQMSDAFARRHDLRVLPMDLYYAWRPDELARARDELQRARALADGDESTPRTDFLRAVAWADLVIDYSGDIWGDNADFLGPDRFEVGLLKDLTVQALGTPISLTAGSPGPFTNERTRSMARTVYSGFDLVTNREPLSSELLAREGFDVSRTETHACPSFRFEAGDRAEQAEEVVRQACDGHPERSRPRVALMLSGWNFAKGPYDRTDRDDDEFGVFAAVVEHMVSTHDADVFLLSHSNGFDLPPAPFRLKQGRDFPIMRQLHTILRARGLTHNQYLLDDVYDPWLTKSILGQVDMVISGRLHGAVAALTQSVPTVILDYGHPPAAHKLRGFARLVGVEERVANPNDAGSLLAAVDDCWAQRHALRHALGNTMVDIRADAERHFEALARCCA